MAKPKFKMVRIETVVHEGPDFKPVDSPSIHWILIVRVPNETLHFPNSSGPKKVIVPGYSHWKRVEHLGYPTYVKV